MPQPFINPYYYQQPMYQPQPQIPTYQPQPQMPAPAPTIAPQTLNGRLIDSIDTISANDVPMQGVSVFPKSDFSEVYIKTWTPNGTIKTVRFLPYNPVNETQTDKLSQTDTDGPKWAAESAINGIMERLTDIENKIDKINKPVKPKKEATDES